MPVRGPCVKVSGGVDGATVTSLTSVLSLPVGAAAGDVIVICCTSATGSNTASAAINGHSFTARSSPVTQSTTLRGYALTYTLVAGDIGNNITVTWTGSSARCLAVGIGLFGVDETSIALGTAFGQTTGNITPPPVTVSAGTAADVVIIAASRTNSGTTVATYTMPAGYTSDVYGALAISTAPEQAMFIGHLTTPVLGSTTVTPGAVTIANSPTNSLTWTIGMQKVTQARSASDTASPSDSVTEAISLSRAASNSSSASDTAAESISMSRAATDSATPTDAVTRASVDARTASDSASPTDTATHTAVSASRTAADTASPTDAAARSWGYARAASDTSSPADSAARAQSSTRAAADAASPSDAAGRAFTDQRAATDTASPSDSATQNGVSRARTASDVASPSDAAARSFTFTRSASDTSSQSDTASRSKSIARAAADTSSSTDAAARTSIAFGRFAFETATPADLAARAETQARAALDVAAPGDTVGVFHTRELTLHVAAVPDRFALAGVPGRFDVAGVPDRFHIDFQERTE